MKHFFPPIILLFLLLASCQSKKVVTTNECRYTDTIYVERQSESVQQAFIDWNSLDLRFDSLVMVSETPSAAVDTAGSVEQPATPIRTKLMLYGGNLNSQRTTTQTTAIERDNQVSVASREDITTDEVETTETVSVAKPINLGRWIAAIIAVVIIGLVARSYIKR